MGFKSIALTVTTFILSTTTHAYTFSIDEFSVSSNGTTIWTDSFDDGVAPITNADYAVSGTVGPEGDGKLALDSSGAVPFAGVGIPNLLRQGVRLKSTNGLTIDETFSVTAIFDLATLNETEMLALYGITLGDGMQGDDNINLWVRHTIDDNLKIQFERTDRIANTITYYDEIVVDLVDHDQVMLTLSRDDLTNNLISASFAYGLGGVFDPTTTFTNTTSIFNGGTLTRAIFQASVPAVPVPPAVWLFGSGLFGLIGIARRKK